MLPKSRNFRKSEIYTRVNLCIVNDLHLARRVPTYMSMTLRIVKISDGARTVLKLCGRIQAKDIEELREQMDVGTRGTVLDLQEVTLVDVEVVRFLGSVKRTASNLRIVHRTSASGSSESKLPAEKTKYGVGYEQRKRGNFT
jgi:hypothetical protein